MGRSSVTAGSWSENNGNPGRRRHQHDFVVDTITPTLAVTVGSSDVNLAHGTALVSFTFSEAPSISALADTTAVGGTLGNLATTDGGLTYTATFTANADTDISNGSVGVTAGSWNETNGNPGTGATSTAFVVDTITPTVAVTVDSSDVNLAAHTALVTFTFSEATSDFRLADTTAVGGALEQSGDDRWRADLHRDLHGQRQHRHQQWLGERHRRHLARGQRQSGHRRHQHRLRGRHRHPDGGGHGRQQRRQPRRPHRAR